MELALNNGFSELSFDEMDKTDGGHPILIGIGIGAGVYLIKEIDEQVEQESGKDICDWAVVGAKKAGSGIKKAWNWLF